MTSQPRYYDVTTPLLWRHNPPTMTSLAPLLWHHKIPCAIAMHPWRRIVAWGKSRYHRNEWAVRWGSYISGVTTVSISGVTRESISGVRGYQYPGYESINIRGTRVSISGVRGINIRGTRVLISGVQGYQYPGYEGINIRGTRKERHIRKEKLTRKSGYKVIVSEIIVPTCRVEPGVDLRIRALL